MSGNAVAGYGRSSQQRGGTMRSVGALCLVLLGLLPGIVAGPASAQPVVSIGQGELRGVEHEGVLGFFGIPFAAPPVGPNRWRAPRPAPSWQGTRDASRFGPSCWQAVSPEGFGPWTHEYVVAGDISEDCLYLNVWAPAARGEPLPVLVWIHGGGFNSGSGAIPIYHGDTLARHGILVVTINYRVNVFGFLAHPELTAETPDAPANFGLLDMIAALGWVQENIAEFGGDPGQVTIAGQSAGAGAVHDLIAAPAARGLFHRAIAQSSVLGNRPMPTLAAAEKEGLAFATEKGAASLADLRALPAEALQPSRGGNAIRFVPVVDGRLLPHAPEAALRSGRFADVPILAGFTADEGSALGSDYGSPDAKVLRHMLAEIFGPLAREAAPLYPAASEVDRSRSNMELSRDRWLAGLYAWAHARSAARAPLHAYIFTRVAPGPEKERWLSFHSSEIPYVFGTLEAAPERGFTAEDRTFSDRVANYWSNFVKTGDPNGSGLPAWPAFDLEEPKLMELGDSIAPRPMTTPAKLDLLRGTIADQAR